MGDAALSTRRRPFGWGLPLGAVVVLGAAAGFGGLLVRAQELPTDVVPVAWDHAACAHCRMHVGERGFAAQLQLTDGRVLDFDDPGCLVSWLETSNAPVHATWLHHHTEDRWLRRAEAGFVAVTPTPMGFGLAAVDASAPGAIGWDAAVAKVRAR